MLCDMDQNRAEAKCNGGTCAVAYATIQAKEKAGQKSNLSQTHFRNCVLKEALSSCPL